MSSVSNGVQSCFQLEAAHVNFPYIMYGSTVSTIFLKFAASTSVVGRDYFKNVPCITMVHLVKDPNFMPVYFVIVRVEDVP
jgi:hypothetical protein